MQILIYEYNYIHKYISPYWVKALDLIFKPKIYQFFCVPSLLLKYNESH